MKTDDIYKQIANCLAEIGIIQSAELKGRFIDNDIEDSLTYISFIVEIEEKFGIYVPDEYLQVNMLETYDDVVDMICKENGENDDVEECDA